MDDYFNCQYLGNNDGIRGGYNELKIENRVNKGNIGGYLR